MTSTIRIEFVSDETVNGKGKVRTLGSGSGATWCARDVRRSCERLDRVDECDAVCAVFDWLWG